MQDTSPLDEDWPFPVDFGYESDGDTRHLDLDWLDSMDANCHDFAVGENCSVPEETGRSLQQGRGGDKGMRPLAHLQEAAKSVAVAARTGI